MTFKLPSGATVEARDLDHLDDLIRESVEVIDQQKRDVSHLKSLRKKLKPEDIVPTTKEAAGK